jgi:dTDP-4-dehydrorhamnose reductase
MASKILVFGAGGQVGRELIATAPLLGCDAVGLTRAEADICEPAAIAAAIARHRPTSIVNAAAYTAVDRAESEEHEALRVNCDGARKLAEAAAAARIPVLHLSTDYVFDGQAHIPYAETDPVAPQGAYARSKAAGEDAVREANDRHLILRTAWVYGPFGTNFLRTMLSLGGEREELGIVDDQTGCPTATPDLARAIIAMMAKAEEPSFKAWGTYHAAGADAVTWYGFARIIFEEASKFGFRTPRLEPITTAEYPTPAPRPAYCVLSTAKLERVFGVQPRPLRESLVACLETLFGESGGSA